MGLFTVIGGHTADSAESLLLSAEQLAVANNVAPGEILDSIAGSTEIFAGFAKEGGENILLSAIQAKKLGISLDQVGTIATGLLNFQDSLNKEIEAGILLGQDLNFQRARELALVGDTTGMMEEVLNQLGGEARWTELNVIQRQAMADALGVDLLTMSKLVSKEKEALTIQGKMSQLQVTNPIPEEAITATAELLNNLKAIGMQFAKDFGPQIENIVKLFGGLVKWFGEGDNALTSFRKVVSLYTASLGFAIGQTIALMMANYGLMTSKVGAMTFGIGIPLAMAAAAGAIGWTMSNISSGKSAANAQDGGITTQQGLVNVHPQEAIVPIEKLALMLKDAMKPVKEEIQKGNRILKENNEVLVDSPAGLASAMFRTEGSMI